MIRIDAKTQALVYGLGKSGASAVNYLLKSRAKVTITDDKPFYDLRYVLEPYLEAGVRFKQPAEIAFSVCDFDFIILSPGVIPDNPFIKLAQKCDIPVISDIELAYEQMKVNWTAITGTNGKTTVTSLTGDIFRKHYSRVIVAGNIGNPICNFIHTGSPSQQVIVEVSSYQLTHTNKFKPGVAIVLNISNDHISWHKNIEQYIESKKKVFQNQQEDDCLILNFDDPVVKQFSMKARSKVYFYSTQTIVQEGAYIKNRKIVIRVKGKEKEICTLKEIQLRGKHNLGNVMAAALASFLGGVPVEDIRNMIRAFQPLAHRLEYLGKAGNVHVYNDSKSTNMDALVKALESFDEQIVLIAGGEDKGCPLEDVVRLIREKVRHVILFGKDVSRFQGAIRDVPVESYTTLKDAVSSAWKLAKRGDVLLFSPGGSSFDLYVDFEQRGDDFKKIIREIAGDLNT